MSPPENRAHRSESFATGSSTAGGSVAKPVTACPGPVPAQDAAQRVAAVVGELGGVAALSSLRKRGISARRASAAVQRQELIRLRNGWFALPTAAPDVADAVRVGGTLSCISRLSRAGLWTMPDQRLHVSVRGHATRLRPALNHPTCLHWKELPWDPPAHEPIDSILSSIARLILCHDLDSAIVTIDSALNTRAGNGRMLTLAELERILLHLPSKYSRIAELVDPRSQSGLESLARLRLRRRGLRVRTQARIANVGYVDVLIGDRLVLELDSRSHHLGTNYEKDRTRDLELFRQGFAVIRVSYQRVMSDWHSVEQSILGATRRGAHNRRAVHRRHGLALPES